VVELRETGDDAAAELPEHSPTADARAELVDMFRGPPTW